MRQGKALHLEGTELTKNSLALLSLSLASVSGTVVLGQSFTMRPGHLLTFSEFTQPKPSAAPAQALQTTYEQASSWERRAQDSLRSLSELPAKWHPDGAQPPNLLAVTQARTTLDALIHRNLEPVSIIPSVEEGVSFNFVRGQRYAALEILNDGSLVVATVDENRVPDVRYAVYDPICLEETLDLIVDFLNGA